MWKLSLLNRVVHVFFRSVLTAQKPTCFGFLNNVLEASLPYKEDEITYKWTLPLFFGFDRIHY